MSAIDTFADVRRSLHERILRRVDARELDLVSPAERRMRVREEALSVLREDGHILPQGALAKVVNEVSDAVVGMGPIEFLLKDPDVTEVMVNGPDDVYVERKGRIERVVDRLFEGEEAVLHLIERIVAPLGLRVDGSSPWVDARLPDGSRVHAMPLTCEESLAESQSAFRRRLDVPTTCPRPSQPVRLRLLAGDGGRGSAQGEVNVPTYDIQRLLYTTSALDSADLAGYSFNRDSSSRVVASRSIERDAWEEAVRDFEEELLEVLDAVAIVAGVALSSYAGAIVSIRGDLQTAAVDAMFPAEDGGEDEDHLTAEREGIERAVEVVRSQASTGLAARHFRESLLTTSGLVSSIHLLRSLESLAGSEETRFKCSCGELLTCPSGHEQRPYTRTVRPELERIVDDEAAFDFFFGPTGHRNALMHGGHEAQKEMRGHVRPLLQSVFAELRKRVGASTSTNPAHASFRVGGDDLPAGLNVYYRELLWLRYSGEPPRLVDLIESLGAGELSRREDIHVLRDSELTKALDRF